jgi:hypothetical protein
VPISRGSLLSSDTAAAHRLEIGICAAERDDGEEILRVRQQASSSFEMFSEPLCDQAVQAAVCLGFDGGGG